MRILVVENEAVIALDLEALLASWGHTVVGIASTGAQALELAANSQPDLALLDIRLRGPLDGIDTGARLQASHGIPLVFLTAHADPPTLRRAGVLHPVGYLLKPIDHPMLQATLELASHRRAMDREHRRLQAQEQRTAALLSALMDGCADAMLAVDTQGKVVQVNQRACDLVGLGGDDLIGADAEALLELNVDEALEHARLGTRYESELRLGDDRRLPVEVTPAAIPFEHQQLLSLLIRDLSEAQARQCEHDRRNRLEASGRLAAGVAHDLCGLLTSMKCSSFLLQEHGDPAIAIEVRQLEESIGRGAALLGTLLGFVRSDSAQLEVLDLRDVVQGLHSVMTHAVGHVASLVVKAGPPAPVMGHRSRLEQLLLNLLFNARDAIEEQGTVELEVGRITLRAPLSISSGTLAPGDYATLRVVDDGSGIQAHALPHIFEPFFSTKSEKQGTGLGMVTVMEVLDEHGGVLHIDSTPGEGTDITAYLPAFDAEPLLNGGTVENPGSVRAPASLHVLLVDDQTSHRFAMAESLRRAGLTVVECSNGREVLAHIASGQRVDCVISDIVMPDLDGVSLRRTAMERGDAPPFIYITGYHRDSLIHMGYDVRDMEILHKPIDNASLVAAVVRRLPEVSVPG